MSKPKAPAKAKAAKKTEATYDAAKLQEIVTATQANSFVYLSEKDGAIMLEKGLIEVNTAMTDEDGNVAARATAAGIAAVGGTVAAAAPAVNKSAFAVDKGVPMPAQRRGGRNSGIYPFDSMDVNDSFFIEATEARPNVAKSMASTISSANKRYKNEDGTHERKFSVRNVEKDSVTGKRGARVFRTA